MNPFEELLTDTVFVEDFTGKREGPFKTSISNKNGLSALIFKSIFDGKEGDKLVRILPSGKEELYTIIDMHYSAGLDEIPPSWELKLTKDNSLVKPSQEKTTNITINNSHGIQIGDHNLQNITDGLDRLIKLIESSSCAESDKQEAKNLLSKFLSNPTVSAVIGGATSGLISLLK